MKIGFTGTRLGMTPAQKTVFRDIIRRLRPSEFHHGDCVGADDEAANIVGPTYDAADPEGNIVVHPPINNEHRANNLQCGLQLPPKSHFARNRDIVNATDLLIATPQYSTPIVTSTRGGTAYTVNYARKQGNPVTIIYPDGVCLDEDRDTRSLAGGPQ